MLKIVNDTERYNISETDASYFASLPSFSMMLSCFIFAFLFDHIGRRNTTLLCAIPQIIAWVLTIFAKESYVFYISRIFTGIGSGCIFTTLPVYVGEVASPKVRGLTGSLFTTINFIGQFFITVLGNYFDVQTTAYICLPLPAVFLIAFLFMPESPYFYLMKKKFDQAQKSLNRLKGRNNADDFIEMKTAVERQLAERGDWKDIFLIKSNRKAIIIGIFLRVSQHLSGLSIYTTSIQYVFEKAGGSISAALASAIFMFCTVCFMFIAGLFSDKLGRRKAYTISTFLGGILMFVEALYFYLDEYQPQIGVNVINWFPLVGLVVCLFITAFGPGVVPTIMIGELFSTSIKAKATILMVFVFGLMMFVVNNIFYLVNSATGLCGPFLIFGLANFGSSILAYLFLPETMGKSLEQIQQLLKSDKLK